MVVRATNVNGGRTAGVLQLVPARSWSRGSILQPRGSGHPHRACGKEREHRLWCGRRFFVEVIRRFCFFISITGVVASLPHLAAQQLTTPAPSPETVPDAPPAGPDAVRYPDADKIPAKQEGSQVHIDSHGPQTSVGNIRSASDDVIVTYENGERCTPSCTLRADHIEYDRDTGDVTVTGHVLMTGGENDEIIHASHGTINIRTQAGRFYDVTGSVGMRPAAASKPGVAMQPVIGGQPPAQHRHLIRRQRPSLHAASDRCQHILAAHQTCPAR